MNALSDRPPLLYVAVILCAIATAVALRDREPAPGVSPSDRRVITLAALFGAFFGARLPYWVLGVRDLCLSTVLFGSGKTIIGGLAGGYLGVEAAKWALGVRAKTGVWNSQNSSGLPRPMTSSSGSPASPWRS